MNALMPKRLIGAGGGSKSGSSGGGASEGPNTLRSVSTVNLLDLLSEGPIEGLVNGPASIYFNGVPLANSQGGYNFGGITWAVVDGLPDQGWMPGFPAAQTVDDIGEPITQAQGPFSSAVTNTAVTSVLVTITLNSLYQTDTSNGNINAFQAGVNVNMAHAGGGYVNQVQDMISGLTNSAYQRSYKITFPPGTQFPVSIQVERTTPDDSTLATSSAFSWTSMTEQVEHQLTYADSAYAALIVNSESFGTSIPVRTYEIKGLLIQIPANYDPIARTYASTGTGTSGGTWDGATFKQAWSNNPAWVLYDLITNDRYGLGDTISSAFVDQFALYQAGQYCDELVPDGAGGQQPRYTFNGVLNSQEDAYKMVQAIASVFMAMTYWGAGQVSIVQDAPAPVVKLFNQTNVIDGTFSYSGTALNARHSICTVQWLDPSNSYRSTVEYVTDPQMIQLFGSRVKPITGLGITNRSQAIRAGKWVLDTERYATETVTFKVSLEESDARPGEIINVADPDYMGMRAGGQTIASPICYQFGVTNYVLNGDAINCNIGGLPQSWTLTGNAGLSVKAVKTGIEDSGLSFVDLQIQGTSTGTAFGLNFETAVPPPFEGQWFNGTSSSWNATNGFVPNTPAATTSTGTINFILNNGDAPEATWAGASPFPAGVNQDFVTATFTGVFIVAITGEHTLGVNFDDGCNLTVKGLELVSALAGGQGAGADRTYTQSGTLYLEAGELVPFTLVYQQGYGDGGVQFLWTQPGASSPSLVPSWSIAGQALTASAYLKLMYGSLGPLESLLLQVATLGYSQQEVDSYEGPVDLRVAAATTYYRAFTTLGAASSAAATPQMALVGTIAAGTAVNAVLRIGGVQLQANPSASDYVPTRGNISTLYTSNSSTVALDAEVTLESGQAYTLYITDPYGAVQTASVANAAGATSLLQLAAPLNKPSPPGSIWMLSSASLEPRPFRVLAVTEHDSNTFDITALLYDPGKYARVEDGVQEDTNTYSDLLPDANYPLEPPASVSVPNGSGGFSNLPYVTVVEFISGVGNTTVDNAQISWVGSADPRTIGYEVQALAQGTTVVADATTAGVTYTFTGLLPGVYAFQVRALGLQGQVSAWVTSATNYVPDSEHFSTCWIAGSSTYGTSEQRNFLRWDLLCER